MRKKKNPADTLDAENISWDEFNAIINSIYDEILITDATGVIRIVNKACERLYRMKIGELVGRNVMDLEREGIFSPSVSAKVIRSKNVESGVHTTSDGRKILVTGIPIFNDEAELTQVVCNSRDLSELITLRQEIEEKNRLIQHFTQEIRRLKTDNVNGLMLYASSKMEEVFNIVRKVAPSDLSVLLIGESGVGKTMMANIIHDLSDCKNSPFQVINCSAIPESLLESELFGYVKGAFTGATTQGKVGLFESVRGGTIFLDEIGDISMSLQVKLLQVLQDRKFRKIGDIAEISADFRLVTATNQDLEAKIKNHQFREDLFYRINGISIHIVPLRKRVEDIGILSQAYLEQFNKKYKKNMRFSGEVLDSFYQYSWPGNIRELKSVVERVCLVADGDLIEMSALPENMRQYAKKRKCFWRHGDDKIYPLRQAVEMMEKDLFCAAYQKHRSTYKVAKVLGISQATAHRKLQKYFNQFNDE